MSDKVKMLPKGFGMPFVKVTDSKNQIILDPITKLPLGTFITQFDYVYREEDDDECNISLTVNNPDIADIPALREQQYLTVQWGYVLDDSNYIPSSARRVMVRDVDIRFSMQGVVITLRCTDGASLLKQKQLSKNKDDNFVDWIQQALGNYRFGTFIESEDYEVETQVPTTMQSTFGTYTHYNTVKGCTTEVNDQGKSYLKRVPPDKLIKVRTFTQLGKTVSTALKDQVKFIPNGPYHVDGRDDELRIHPTNFNQPSMASFSWGKENGEIISFDIRTRKKQKALDVTNSTSIDGETKSIGTNSIQSDGANPKLNVDAISGADKKVTYQSGKDGSTGGSYKSTEATKKALSQDSNLLKQEAGKYLDAIVTEYQDMVKNGTLQNIENISLPKYTVKVKATVKDTVDPRDYGSLGSDVQGNPILGSRAVGWDKLKRDNTVQIVPKSNGSKYEYWENPTVIQEKEFEIELSAKDLLGYAGDADSSKIKAFNEISDALQKSIEATLVIIGHPTLESSKIITINNISNKYSGDWYIKEVSHEVNPSTGYITTLDLIKKTASNGTYVSSQVKVNTSSLAKKIQKIAKDQSDPATIAMNEAISKSQDKIMKDFADASSVNVIYSKEGKPVVVDASYDTISLNKITETGNINRNDQSIKDKTK